MEFKEGKKYNTEHGIMIFDHKGDDSGTELYGYTESGQDGIWYQSEVISEYIEEEKTMNKTKIAVGQIWKTRDGDQVKILSNDGDVLYPWDVFFDNDDMQYFGCFTDEGLSLNSIETSEDLIELVYDPNIQKEYTPKFSKKEILQAILDEKSILFRVDEGETWQEVKDNDWVLRMIADKTEYCFKVKPKVEELFMIYNVYAAKGQMKTADWTENLEPGDTQVKYTFEDKNLVSVGILNGVCI